MPKYLKHKTSLLKEIMPKGIQNPLNRTKNSLLQPAFSLPPLHSPSQFQPSATSGHRTGDSFVPIPLSTYFLSVGSKAVS